MPGFLFVFYAFKLFALTFEIKFGLIRENIVYQINILVKKFKIKLVFAFKIRREN